MAAGILGLSLNYGAYLSEVFRGGIQSVPPTQREAATTIGLSYAQTLRFVILPQAFRTVLPPTANYFLSLFKDTSLLSVITIKELMFSGLLLEFDDLQCVRHLHRNRDYLFRSCAIRSRWLLDISNTGCARSSA